MADSPKGKSLRLNVTFLDRIVRAFSLLEDFIFEKRYGLQLGGTIPAKQLVTDKQDALLHANNYQAISCRNSRKLFDEAKRTGIRFRSFVDIGSGKGKACFFASKQLDVDNIIGVEFSKPLIDIAELNKKQIGSAKIAFLQADASEYLLPDGNNLIFLFNTFDDLLIERFIAHNVDHFRTNRSVIAYANDMQRAALTRCGFTAIYRSQSRKISLWEYSKSGGPGRDS